ncbi:uncharacterized protein LOC131219177 [Magnolia sinica]|uniref:uncharacterized protein LOC131219177 n=1 Tax=Magnolia sinica TaxID=86752 RepID=UPI0026580D3F|nr:uncharacterized protein LOC131219177 [Magnolia sinica]
MDNFLECNSGSNEHDHFTVRKGKYYVVDAGYAHSPGFMAPYRGVRYHVNEYRTGRNPVNAKELFNYRHEQLRNVIKCCFGVLKSRFSILKTALQYPVVTQVKIVLACCVVHNFIRLSGDDEIVDADGTLRDGNVGVSPLTLENATIDDLCDVLNATQTERDA